MSAPKTVSAPAPIAFMDLATQQRRIKAAVDANLARVLAHGQYILGPEVGELEKQLAAFAGVKHAIGCASGTDALVLPLLARGIGAGDAVFSPSFTFIATAEAAVIVGATPVFVDVDPETFLLDPQSLTAAIAQARAQGLRPAAVIPVDLFGQPADYAAIDTIARGEGLFVIADAAQSFGGARGGKRVGAMAPVTSTSFFPSKPLGCYGDGGAILTDDDEIAKTIRSLRVHGQGAHKYDNIRIGVNSRLDSMQAAVLLAKLTVFEDELVARDRVAKRYDAALANVVRTPRIEPGVRSAWALYTIAASNRNRLAERLKARGVPTAIYYPIPLHRQQAYRSYPIAPGGLAVSERLADEVISLPMHPYLEPAAQDAVVAALRESL
ncbi:MAG: DegT/DnrJ/EryC1/StrS family aminotransferase [Alphaproteobacteria bacterium]|nr:DegT/DnrJ/EryC1/StrS family aminotransferase [Alphaproteobacteria bacterium]